MALVFPASPAEGQIFYHGVQGIPLFVYRSGTWIQKTGTAQTGNRIVNPSFMVSQQMGSGGSAVAAANGGFYAADQWMSRWSLTAGGTVSTARYDTPSTNGSKSVYIATSVAQATIPAADYVLQTTLIEGTRIADFEWGTAGAHNAVLRFTITFGLAGTYHVRVGNGVPDRSFVASFTYVGGWQDFVIPIPGDTTGTWPTDNTRAMYIDFVMAIGTTYHGVAGWQAGNKYATSAQTNGVSGVYNFHLAAVGLYLDPNNTGMAPPYQTPNFEDDLRDCQRYWYKSYAQRGVVTTATNIRCANPHPVPMRTTPALSLVGTALRNYDAAAAPTVASIANAGTSAQHVDVTVTSATGLTVGRPGMVLVDGVETNYIACSARM